MAGAARMKRTAAQISWGDVPMPSGITQSPLRIETRRQSKADVNLGQFERVYLHAFEKRSQTRP